MNNTLTILLDTLTSGIVAVIGATMAIVIFGEIIPQVIIFKCGAAIPCNDIIACYMWCSRLNQNNIE